MKLIPVLKTLATLIALFIGIVLMFVFAKYVIILLVAAFAIAVFTFIFCTIYSYYDEEFEAKFNNFLANIFD